MKILLLGASGQLGQHLLREASKRGHRVTGTSRTARVQGLRSLDLADREATYTLVREVRPDVILNAAGWSHVDECEADPDLAHERNVTSARHAAEAALEAKARIVLFSSHYVYDGTEHLYNEEATPRPLSVFGRTKLEAEIITRTLHPGALVVRTAVMYGPERRPRNFVYQLIRASLLGQEFRVAHDSVCSPTYSPNLAAASVELMEQGLGGIFHVAGGDVLSRYDFALMACDVMKLNEKILRPVSTDELGFKAPRPLCNGLDVSKAQSHLRMPLFNAVEGLSAFYKQAPVDAIAELLRL